MLTIYRRTGVMYYSIGEVSNIMGIAISTLRYYDREGMFPDMERGNGGIRISLIKKLIQSK